MKRLAGPLITTLILAGVGVILLIRTGSKDEMGKKPPQP